MRKQHKCGSDAQNNIMVNQVQELIDDDPSRSMRNIVRDLWVLESTSSG